MSNVIIPIRGKDYSVSICYLKQDTLRFYSDNPRVYSVLHDDEGKVPKQEEIEEHLQKMDHVRELRDDIKANGGLIEPLYVKEATLEVVEGNSRLAAYRLLAEENPLQWEKVKCALLPKEVPDSAIASLLGQLHLKGKKNWVPYEQASFLYRRHHRDKITIPALLKELPLSDKAVRHKIAVIEFMIKHNDNAVEHWSHYDEMLKNRKIKQACADHADFEETVVDKIKAGEMKAVEVRDKLKVLCATKSEKPIKLLLGGGTLDDSVKAAKSLGGDHTVLQKVKRFRSWIITNGTKQAVKDAPEKIQDQILYELRQIQVQLTKLLKIAK
jgi:hypothetical protein